ncbi:MAG: hypothetical protein QM760_02540 [Nibricoccus sp.]
MSDTSQLVARVEALEKAVQSLLRAVNLLEKLFEQSGVADGAKKTASKATKKKRAPVKKRVSRK